MQARVAPAAGAKGEGPRAPDGGEVAAAAQGRERRQRERVSAGRTEPARRRGLEPSLIRRLVPRRDLTSPRRAVLIRGVQRTPGCTPGV